MSDGHWFKSTLFDIEPGEDEEINPGRYGRQLAVWIKRQLEAQGYQVEDVINEDWGRCVMCQRSPFALWVGVGNVDDESLEEGQSPRKEDVVWHCFAVSEGGLMLRLRGKKSEIDAAREKLDADLRSILLAQADIQLVAAP